MFRKPTVILVGAGASAEFGLPTGEAIYKSAASESTSSQLERADNEAQFLTSFWEYLCFSNQHDYQHQFRQLVDHLQGSTSYSIDLYSFYNPSFAEAAKYYTIWSLIKAHFEIRSRPTEHGDNWRYGKRCYPWRQPYVGSKSPRPNWLGTLTNQFLSGARRPEDLANNNLTFVTLNYDRVIEEAFTHFICHHEIFSAASEDVMPEVIHVHGALDPIGDSSLNSKFYRDQVGNVQFILDSLENPPNAAKRAVEALDAAADIYCVGFAFEENNCELLKAGKWGGKAAALNFSGDVRSEMSMRRMGLPESKIWKGTSGNPRYLGIAASEGFFAL